MSVFDVLNERGFIRQLSHEQEIIELLDKEKITFYIGFDPTADSLHVGHYVQLMAMAHMQRAGHRPIALIGGGTTMIGDPSGKSDMRKMLSREDIDANGERFKVQMKKFLDFDDGKALMVNNADWLLNINYVEFLREIGVHFSVNRMLAAECYKARLERGLTFMEFNYMLMQSYDFYELNKRYGAVMQLGGDDQWSNILAGANLIRVKEQKPAFAMTFALLTNSEGKKMGKTERGAVWLDPEKCSPYDFYQYWRNVGDADVKKCLSLLTFLPMEQVNELTNVEGSALNEAKRTLAYEVTKQVHGEDEAQKARESAESLFGGSKDADKIPEALWDKADFEADRRVVAALVVAGLAKSKGDARRLIEGGGVLVNDEKVSDVNAEISEDMAGEGVTIQKGKKAFKRVKLA